MGLYFNPGNENYTRDAQSEIYVDKTGLIKELNKILRTSDCLVAVSHARRFGKSQAADMLEAYYSLGCDSRTIFSKFEIARDDNFENYYD